MWKKEEGQTGPPTAQATSPVTTPRPTTTQSSGRATIGPSITIRGDVTGSEDLLIQGQIDGSITLADHSVGVGSEGRVNANIIGRLITIEGRVEGDLTAQEQIVLRGSSNVKGDIKAPRVVLEDGATFRGLVDMGSSRATKDVASTETAGSVSSDRSTTSTRRESPEDAAAAATTAKAQPPSKSPSAESDTSRESKSSGTGPSSKKGSDDPKPASQAKQASA